MSTVETQLTGNDASSQLDLKSVLDRIQTLEREKAAMTAELQSKDVKLEKFTESKRVEMQQLLDSVIKKWLQSIETKVYIPPNNVILYIYHMHHINNLRFTAQTLCIILITYDLEHKV
jgi:hypothetical protein